MKWTNSKDGKQRVTLRTEHRLDFDGLVELYVRSQGRIRMEEDIPKELKTITKEKFIEVVKD